MDHITLAGSDSPERQLLAAIVAELSNPDPEVNYQLRSVYDGPWVVSGEGPIGRIQQGEVYLSAFWSRLPAYVWISANGSLRWGLGGRPPADEPSLTSFYKIIETYCARLTAQVRRAA
ncbi:MAG TPA: hypothetical protein PK095_00100 [Myxococcota bacterium]|nr:hypothetical protein [Myxococcota bacterium]